MSQRILIPYDDSEPARRAIRYAFETFPKPSVELLYVVATPEGYWSAFGGAEGRRPTEEEARAHAEDVLATAEAIVSDVDGDADTAVEIGRPDRAIVEHADEGAFDAVVIGSHGRDGVSRIMLGSVAESVVRRSPTPVLVVR